MVVEDFESTVSQAESFNSVSDLRKSLTVILMYTILWSTGLLAVMLCSARQNRKKNASSERKDLADRSNQLHSDRVKTKEDMRLRLTAYVNESLPSVFQSKPLLIRLFDEVLKHHRYLLALSTNSNVSEEKRVLTGIQLLTVQSMLMFILAYLYELQVVVDAVEKRVSHVFLH